MARRLRIISATQDNSQGIAGSQQHHNVKVSRQPPDQQAAQEALRRVHKEVKSRGKDHGHGKLQGVDYGHGRLQRVLARELLELVTEQMEKAKLSSLQRKE